jgi:hypothetical protein
MNDPASLQSILFWVARKIGLAPDGDNANLDPDKAWEILGFIDDRLREGWDLYDFVEIVLVEERAYRDDYDPAKCYNQGDIVWDWTTRAYYQALLTQTGGPLSNQSVWMANPKVTPMWIPWAQTGKNRIGACLGAWTKNPYEDNTTRRIQFVPSNRGLEFSRAWNAGATAWLVYRMPYPGIGQAEWDAAIIYSVGDQVYEAPDSWVSLIDANQAKDPAISPEAWAPFRIPYPFVRFVRQAAYSDTLIVDGQNEKAPNELNAAYGYLQQAFDQQTIQQGQRENWQGYSR